MAIGDPYATLADFRDWQKVGSQGTGDDAKRLSALKSSARAIERITGRQFNNLTVDGVLPDQPVSRDYIPADLRHCDVDDFYDYSDLVLQTDPGGQGEFSSTWDSMHDVEYRPHNGLSGGIPVPYNELRACGGLYFPKYVGIPYRREAVVRLTTVHWGWAQVPDDIHEANLIIAAQEYKMKDAPFGNAGSTQFGIDIRVRNNGVAMDLLSPFMVDPVNGG